jgi:hypothetical protein
MGERRMYKNRSQSVNRINRLIDRLGRDNTNYEIVETELRVLGETIDDELKKRFFYAYPQKKIDVLTKVADEWSRTIDKFPSAKIDIYCAVDCYVSDHNTAAVFHLMRVAEYGLRALARERSVTLPKNRPIEWGTWQDIISQINNSVKKIANKPTGPARSRALEFYSGALGQFEAFKEAYRNDVMHARQAYDEGQALSVLSHVREFMERLSSRIGENPKAIRWGLKR